ncbi:hypothetical protein CPC08DRAFT_434101 [Agrocybe pediades]|nr:hypothetical protein CPC08DRAFT_434101 [Agrocybe pediades]
MSQNKQVQIAHDLTRRCPSPLCDHARASHVLFSPLSNCTNSPLPFSLSNYNPKYKNREISLKSVSGNIEEHKRRQSNPKKQTLTKKWLIIWLCYPSVYRFSLFIWLPKFQVCAQPSFLDNANLRKGPIEFRTV